MTSDIAMVSSVTKLALDSTAKVWVVKGPLKIKLILFSKVLYITDPGTKFVVKVGLQDNSSYQFG